MKHILLAGLLSFAFAAQSAEAGFVVFTDRTAWVNAVSGTITTDPFDNDIARSNQFTFDSGVVSTLQVDNGQPHEVIGGTYTTGVNNAEFLTTWDFPSLISGFGGDFTSTTSFGKLQVTGNFNGVGDETVVFSDFLSGDGDGFLGIVSMVPISSVLWSAPDREQWYVDNLSFVAVSPVPEPSTFALLSIGGIALVGYGARRKRQQAA